MAEMIASTILKAVIQKLADEAVKQVGRVKGIRSELESLEETLSHFQDLLVDASEKEIKQVPVQNWVNKLKHLVYDIDDILDDLATDAMRPKYVKNSGASTSKVRKLIVSCCTNLSLCTKTYRRLDKIKLRLQELEKERTDIGLKVENGGLGVRGDRSKDKNRVLETSLVDVSSIVGRQGDKDELIDKLLGDDPRNKNFSIVPIVGMGGVGKTTLAKIVYNDERVKSHFELKGWVCVSDEWDSFQISKSIFQSVGGEDKKFENFNLLQEALVTELGGKKFLLVLDDVWTESYKDWETLVRPFSVCARGSKVIITTRKDQLLQKLDCGQPKQLQCLSHDDAVSLFCQNALNANNFDLYPTLKVHGEYIVGKCKGLPLALIALGRLLRRKDDEGWKEMVDSEIWSLKEDEEEGGGILNSLKLSYHELPASLKQLFAYCSLFPKDDLFEKDGLVLLWMAEGFLHQSDHSSKTEERLGHDYFEELLSRSFFQHTPDDKSLFVMHDLMHDLATSVAGEFFFRLEKEMGRDVRELALEKLRHMSFVGETYQAYKKFMVFKEANCLRTFLSVGVNVTNYLPNKVLVDLLPHLPLLRVINLSNHEISEVPECIGSLKHLRYINLSRTRITNLPESVCDLYNLQTLIVSGCYSLAKLPSNFSKLKNLRHLDIRDTPALKDMPLGIGELKSLQTLSKIIIGGENDFSIAQLKDLKNLRGSVFIQGLNKVKKATEAREANLSQKKLNELKLEWSNDESDGSRQETDIKEVLDVLKPCDGELKKLEIVNYCGLGFPNWVGDTSFCRLAHVSISWCTNCKSLPPLGQLPSLKALSFLRMDDVKVVGSEFLGNGVSFRALEDLSFVDMLGWEVWLTSRTSTTGVVREAVFPCLKVLHIRRCPSLVEFPFKGDKVFPCLKELHIEDCAKLNELSFKREKVFLCLKKLHIIRCPTLVEFSFKGDADYAVFPRVKELQIKDCPSLVEVSFKGDKVFPFLQELCIERCSDLLEVSVEALPSLRVLAIKKCGDGVLRSVVSAAPSVTKLYISRISGLTNEVWNGVILDQMDLKAVEKLTVKKCDELRYLWESKEAGSKVLVNLRKLEVVGCENLVSLGEKDEEEYNYGSNLLTSLSSLEVEDCDNLKHLSCPSNIETLGIIDCDSITCVSYFSKGGGQKLKSLTIHGCTKLLLLKKELGGEKNIGGLLINSETMPLLEYFNIFTHPNVVEFGGNFIHLRTLLIDNCESTTESLFADLQLQSLTSLTDLVIWNCPNMDVPTDGVWPPNLCTLLIGRLKKPISEWGPQKFPSTLVHLTLNGEREAACNWSELSHLHLPSSLTRLVIDGFNNLERVSEGLQHLTSLQHLSFWWCPKLKDLPETLLPSLLSLGIGICPILKERCSKRGGPYWSQISHIPYIQIDFELI